jgi:plastocyanin
VSGTEVPAIIVLTSQDEERTPSPERVPAMDQVARTFLPPLMVVRTGHPAEFHNSDTEMHNVNVKDAKTREQAFNVAIGTDDKYVYTFQRDGVYDVSCDVHAGMSAQIVVAPTPHVTLADRDGRFAFPKIASGSYQLTVYAGPHTIERTIEVGERLSELDLR